MIRMTHLIRMIRLLRCAPVVTAVLLFTFSSLFAAEKTIDDILPEECVQGWAMDGKVTTYTPDNLYKYIDGEAELYMPYGFRKAATVMYLKPGSADTGIVTNIFEMGSLLEAFGIYSNYRTPALEQVRIGAEGFADESQLMFYQDRYFVQIEASGSVTEGGFIFRSCAEAVSRNIADSKEKPRELQFLKVPEAVPLTEKYYASGLLGHGFFGKGFTGEVTIEKARAKSVLMLAGSEKAAVQVFTDYEKYLKESKVTPALARDKGGNILHAMDPLYKGVVLAQSGQYVVGVVGLKEPHDGDALIAELVKNLPKW